MGCRGLIDHRVCKQTPSLRNALRKVKLDVPVYRPPLVHKLKQMLSASRCFLAMQ